MGHGTMVWRHLSTGFFCLLAIFQPPPSLTAGTVIFFHGHMSLQRKHQQAQHCRVLIWCSLTFTSSHKHVTSFTLLGGLIIVAFI